MSLSRRMTVPEVAEPTYRLTRPIVNGARSRVWYVAWSEQGRSKRRSTGCEDREGAEQWFATWREIIEKYADEEPAARPSAPAAPAAVVDYIYFIRGETTGLIKIGFARNPARRLTNLQIGSPDRLALLGTILGMMEDEFALHERFAHLRKHGEWFEPGDDLLAFIREHAECAS